MKVPGSESSKERKFHGAKVPGSKLARVLLELSLQGANWPGSKKAVIHGQHRAERISGRKHVLLPDWLMNLILD